MGGSVFECSPFTVDLLTIFLFPGIYLKKKYIYIYVFIILKDQYEKMSSSWDDKIFKVMKKKIYNLNSIIHIWIKWKVWEPERKYEFGQFS